MSVGHELKTPLTAIDGYAELLQDGAVEPREAAEVLSLESARLRRLIADLLDLARIDRSEFTVRRRARRPRRHGRARRSPDSRASRRRWASCSRPTRRSRRRPAATPGACCRSPRTSSRTRCAPRRAGARCDVVARPGLLSVSDTGPGLSAEGPRPRLRAVLPAPQVQRGPEVGTGLGLAIVKDLAEAMGGYVEVESEPGAAAPSRIDLPLPQVAAPIDA